jgi:bifunctional non-homologous end joining protein LigD
MECKEVKSILNIPLGDEWQYEVKLDGYRCIAIKQNNEVELYSRPGLLFQKFLNVCKLLLDQPVKSFVVDGEVVALDSDGRPDFNALQHAGSSKRKVHFYAFDLLHCDGDDLLNAPLAERQKRLQSEFQPNDYFHIPGPLNADLDVVIEKIEEFGFEGVIAKRKNSIYTPGQGSRCLGQDEAQAERRIHRGRLHSGAARN